MALSEEATFRYLEWNDIFRHERPFQILIDIPPDAPDQRRTNCTFASQSKILVKDVRDNLEGFQLDTHGFTFVKHESKLKDTQFKDRVEVEKMYVKECEDLIKQYLEGVDRVHIFNWLVRNTASKEEEGKIIDMNNPLAGLGPATVVHVDQTSLTAVQRVLNELPSEAEYLLQGRLRLVNLWRPINGPVESWPLALCDGRTVSPTSLIASERLRNTWSGGTTFVLYEEDNKWYYMSNQENDEVAIFKNFDSKEDVAQYAAHSSFKVECRSIENRPRESIEVRAMVFTYPENV